MKYFVYMHENKINHKVYIGITHYIDNPNIRWKNGKGYEHQYFGEKIAKYGWENFNHIILENNIDAKDIDKRENFWIDKFQSLNPIYGYNRCKSGEVSEETKIKMSQSWTEERRKEQSFRTAQMNKTIDRTGSNNSMYGRKRSGKDAGRKRKVMCLETGQIFETLTEASKWCNPNGSNLRSHIAAQIKGKRKSCGKHPVTKEPLHWRYIN